MRELTQDDIQSLYQSHKNIFVRLDLYENAPDANGVLTFRKIDEVSGVVIEGSIQEDADADIRRTADLQIHVQNSSFVLSSSARIWLDKYISLYIGYESQRTKEMLWYPLGILEMTEASYNYDATSQLLSLSLADMVVSMNGTKKGQIPGAMVKFEADELSIKKAIEATISELGGWHNYLVDEIGEYGYENVTSKNRIPYTIEMGLGASVYEIVTKLRDLYPGYESFFQKDGTFRVRRIPTCLNEPVMFTHEQLMPLVIAETSNSLDLTEVRNITQVFGKSFGDSYRSTESSGTTTSPGGSTSGGSSSSGSASGSSDTADAGYFSEMVSGTNGDYVAEFEDFKYDTIDDDMVFTFIPNHSNPGSCTLKINDLAPVPILMSVPNVGDKEIPAGFIEEGMPIVVRYEPDENFRRRFVYLGRTQIRGIYILVSRERTWNEMQHDILRFNTQNIEYGVNPDSPLTVDKIGERIQVLSGDDYGLIDNEVGALERAQYETWLKTNMSQRLMIETILIPWLEVNQKIGYESPLAEMERKELGLEIDHDYDTQYIIKRIDRDLTSGTQTLELVRFYDLYPWIISSKKIHV